MLISHDCQTTYDSTNINKPQTEAHEVLGEAGRPWARLGAPRASSSDNSTHGACPHPAPQAFGVLSAYTHNNPASLS